MEIEEGQQPNRLIYKKSPYLLQHAHNPVAGIHGETRLLPRHRLRTSRSSYPSAIRHVIDVTSLSQDILDMGLHTQSVHSAG